MTTKDMTTGTGFDEWSKRVGINLQTLRHERKLSAQELSDRTEVLGHHITRSTIANLESGRKSTVGIDEVAVLAAALDAAPIRLLFDVEGDAVEALPGRHESQARSADWFSGITPLSDAPQKSSSREHAMWQFTGPMYYFRKHDNAKENFLALLAKYPEPDRTAENPIVWDLFRARADNLWTTRCLLESHEVTPPTLSDFELAALDRFRADA